MSNICHDPDDPIDRTELAETAAYLFRKHSISDEQSTEEVFNLENPVGFRSLLDAMNNKEDILTHGQMLLTKDAADFKKAQEPELKGLYDLGVFEYVPRNSIPKGSKILRSV